MRGVIAAALLCASGCYSGLAGDADTRATAAGDGQDDAGDDAAEGGDDGQDGGDDGPSASCDEPGIGGSTMVRLTRGEYDNAVRDLLDLDLGLATSFTADEKIGPFDANAVAPASELAVEQYLDAAGELAAASRAEAFGAHLPNTCAGGNDTECGEAFVTSFLPRAFRRPITEAERADAIEIFELGVEQDGRDRGLELVIAGALASPAFLYKIERGGVDLSDAEAGTIVPLTSYEIASRLSFYLWQSMPDDVLFEAAAADALSTPEQLEAQARRMLDDDRARAAIADFHLQWLGVDALPELEKQDAIYTPELAQAMMHEIEEASATIALGASGKVSDLLLSRTATVDAALADIYGAEQTGQIELPADQRAGLITRAGFIAATSHPNASSPTLRGQAVREQVLCQIVPPPPNEVDNTLPEGASEDMPVKERLEEHQENPSCAGCHKLMDPIGFGLENYDELGRWRTMDGPFEVDPVGELEDIDANDIPFSGPVELSERLAADERVVDCYARQAFQYAFRRPSGGEDQCTVATLSDDFVESEGAIRELLVQVVLQDAFTHRATPE
ncbi:MAG: DUF1592 domain-containing protein [Myxococcota bacterium]